MHPMSFSGVFHEVLFPVRIDQNIILKNNYKLIKVTMKNLIHQFHKCFGALVKPNGIKRY